MQYNGKRLTPSKQPSRNAVAALVTDGDLATLILAGNENAFAELHVRYQKLVAHLVRRYFQRGDEVEEVVQLVFIRVWRGIQHFRGENAQSLAAWIVRVATNSCYDELRRRQRHKEDLLSQLNEEAGQTVPVPHAVSLTANDLEQITVSRDLLDKLLGGLEPCDREVFVMLKGEHHSIAEIAALTGWSEAKIKMRIRRSRFLLQRRSRRLL